MELSCVQHPFNKKARLELYSIFESAANGQCEYSVGEYIHTCAKMPRTSMENNRRPGCCSCNLYTMKLKPSCMYLFQVVPYSFNYHSYQKALYGYDLSIETSLIQRQ